MKSIRELIETFELGDKLTDQELEVCIKHLNELVDLLIGMGPKWWLPCKEANSIRLSMEDMRRARESSKINHKWRNRLNLPKN